MKALAGVLLVAVALLSGCASIVSENSYEVILESTPAEADFIITDRDGRKIHSGKTPSTVWLTSSSGYFKNAAYKVAFSKSGYEPQEVELEAEVDGWYLGNVLVVGIFGMLVIDPVTGAMWKLPEAQSVVLDRQVADETPRQASLQIVTPDQVPDGAKDKLVKVR